MVKIRGNSKTANNIDEVHLGEGIVGVARGSSALCSFVPGNTFERISWVTSTEIGGIRSSISMQVLKLVEILYRLARIDPKNQSSSRKESLSASTLGVVVWQRRIRMRRQMTFFRRLETVDDKTE